MTDPLLHELATALAALDKARAGAPPLGAPRLAWRHYEDAIRRVELALEEVARGAVAGGIAP